MNGAGTAAPSQAGQQQAQGAGFGAGATNPNQTPPGMQQINGGQPNGNQPNGSNTQVQPGQSQDNANAQADAEQLKKLGVTPEAYQRLLDAGIVMVPPRDLEHLPNDLQSQLKERERELERKGAQLARDQLHQSMEKNTQELEQVRKLLAEREKKIKEIEDEEAKRLKEEEDKKKSQDQKFEELRNETKQAIESISNSSQQRIEQLQQELHVANLSARREKLLAEAGGNIIADLVPNPMNNPKMTEEELLEGYKMAKERWEQMRAHFIEEAKKELQMDPAQFTGQPSQPAPGQFFNQPNYPQGGIPSQVGTRPGGTLPPGGSHVGQQPQRFDSNAVRTMGREALEAEKSRWLKHFGFEQ